MSFPANNKTDVIIVGAGIVGICCALSIIETGRSVRLIDRGEPGQSTSYGNAGVISPWSILPQSMPGLWKKIPGMVLKKNGPIAIRPSYLPKLVPWGLKFLKNGTAAKVAQTANAMEILNQSNIELYRQHLDGTGHENLIRDSWYIHAFRNPSKASLENLSYTTRLERGIGLERIESAELRTVEPAISDEFQAAILMKGQARALSPGKIGEVLSAKAAGLGVQITKACVTGLSQSRSGGWEVQADGQTYHASQIVVAAGAWSAKLLTNLGVNIPLEAERGYHVEFPNPGVKINNSVMDMDMLCVASSMEGGIRVAGTAEFAGLDTPPSTKRVNVLKMAAKRMLPGLKSEGMKSWMGSRPSFPDSLPMLGEFSDHKGLFSAFGHGHCGLMMAPKTGKIIADLISNKPMNADLSPFSVERFQ